MEKDVIVEVRQIMPEEKQQKKTVDYLRIFEIAPKFFWILFGIVIFYMFYPQIKYDILPNVASFNVAGFGVTMKEDLSKLSQNKADISFYNYISPVQQELIIARANRLYKKLNGTKILWADINIDSNKDLRRILKKWGVEIDCSLSDNETFAYLNNAEIDSEYYDILITNNSNDTHVIDGTAFAKKVREMYAADIPIILFSASRGNQNIVKELGVPENIFAATNRYDYLFHFIFDALERGNTPYPASIQRYLPGTDNF
ncbi:MAG: response regulator [Ferruginibacter sp.]